MAENGVTFFNRPGLWHTKPQISLSKTVRAPAMRGGGGNLLTNVKVQEARIDSQAQGATKCNRDANKKAGRLTRLFGMLTAWRVFSNR